MVGETISAGGVTPDQMPHTFWRLKFLANNGSNAPSVRELAFFGSDYTTEVPLNGSGFSSTYYTGGEPALAFDGDRTTEWSGSSTIAIGSSYLGFQFNDPVAVTGFRLLQNDYYTYLVTQVQLEYSDNNVTWYSKGSAISFNVLGYTSYTDFEVISYAVERVLAGQVSLPALTITGDIGNGANLTNDNPIYLPSMEIDAGILGVVHDLPALTIEASGTTPQTVGSLNVLLPSIEATGEDIPVGSGSSSLTLPKITCEAVDVVGVRATLPSLEVSASSTQSGYGEVSASLLFVTIDATGSTENLITVDVAIPAVGIAASSLLGQAGSVNAEMAALALSAEGFSGTISSVAVSLPLMVVDADVIHSTTATLDIELPVLVLEATTPEAVLSLSGAYVLNLSNGALTEFDSFAYNSMAVLNGQIVVASSTGLFLLAGKTDNGNIINASARLPLSDLGGSNSKRLSTAYVGYRSDGDLMFTVSADDGTEYSYLLQNSGAPGVSGGRTKCGKGLEGRYFKVGIDNSNGSTMDINDIEMLFEVLTKKAG